MTTVTIQASDYLRRFLYVKDRETAQIVPLIPRPAQDWWLANRSQFDIILKSRREGFSCIIGGEFFSDQQTSVGLDCMVVAHTKESTDYLFGMVELFLDHLHPAIKPRVGEHSSRSLTFPDRVASYTVQTAGAHHPGLGSAIHRLHCSEFAFWEDDPESQFKGLSECVPITGKIRIESTPNGIGNYFYQMYNDAKFHLNSYKAFFFPWWLDPGYQLAETSDLVISADRGQLTYSDEEVKLIALHALTDDQIRWRRRKVRDLREKFPEQYPEDDVDCFLLSGSPFFDKIALANARKRTNDPLETAQRGTGEVRIWTHPDPLQRYALGVDAAEGLQGADRSAAFIFSLNTGKQAATLQGLWGVSEFANLINEYSRLYNNAYVGVENDKYGALVLKYLEETFHYPNLHYHPLADKPEEVKLGYPTTSLAKAQADNELNDALKSAELEIRDKEVLGEMSSYVRHANGKLGAATGAHDDLVSATKIAWQMRLYAPTRPIATVEVNRERRLRRFGQRRAPAFKRYLERVEA